jgi:hypothetical protein
MIKYSCLHEVALKFKVPALVPKGYRGYSQQRSGQWLTAERKGTTQCQISEHVMTGLMVLTVILCWELDYICNKVPYYLSALISLAT